MNRALWICASLAAAGCTAKVTPASTASSSSGTGATGSTSSSGSSHGATGSSGASTNSTTTGGSSTSSTSTSSTGSSTSTTGSTGTSTTGTTGSQTVSNWLGTNVSADLYFVDVSRQLSPFDTPAAQLDANGYPVAGASGTSSTDIGFVLPSGTYTLTYQGNGTLSVSGIGQLAGSFQNLNGVNQAQVTITGTPGAFGNFLNLVISNGAGQTVTDVHLLYPGFSPGTSQVFLPHFLNLLTPFRALRFMDWLQTNNSTIANWSEHPESSSYGQSPNGQPYDLIVELVNETGKDMWVTIPEHADDAFVTQFADYLRDHLDYTRIDAARAAQGNTAPFQLLFEEANETWNQGFSAYDTFLTLANANTSRYTGTYNNAFAPSWMGGNSDLMKVGQVEGDRLARHAAIFRTEFDSLGKSSIIAPVLSGWAIGAAYTDVALQFIQANYGDPKTIVSYVATAPYFAPDDSQTGDMGSLFAGCTSNIQSYDSMFTDFENLTTQYQIKMAAYEGGQSLTGTTNQQLKHLAQHDERMYETYLTYLSFWKSHFGEALFMHFSLAGTPGIPENIFQYGYWGSIGGVLVDTSTCGNNLPTLTGSESISSETQYCPKYRALREQVP
ncbi:MAG: hypothetical protein JST54_31055 [Deltaproteobacteria bacterium]|nr:hypothetical protein [Deltaproteobacteria bacterium]